MPEKPRVEPADLVESRRAIADAKEAAKQARVVDPAEGGEAQEASDADSAAREEKPE
ncbi:hypothetical protein [Amycolatopsis acidicola]|uniref:hypothetical protein n=1 Tax=Amycolatopsis acidicola TaxID=2596893 RepID=UPI00140BF814|nr:hypothetical protein [Amycolatopsis acidicola]